MKKLISIGVALAVLAMVVLPIGAAAQGPCDIGDFAAPTTYAKIPFAILQSGFTLLGGVLEVLATEGLLPASFSWLPALMTPLGDWVGGPLGWTVDMLAWGLSLFGAVMAPVQALLTAMGIDLGGLDLAMIGDITDAVACGLFTPFVCNLTNPDPWTPCD